VKNGICLIIAGGELHQPEFYQKRLTGVEYVIAADGGARHAKDLGLIPNLVLGDFDTLTPQELKDWEEQGVITGRFPDEKDFTETHLAVLRAVELGYTDLVIIAALGGRLDHALANIMLLALPQTKEHNLLILDEHQEIRLIRDQLIIEGEPGQTISLLPLSDKVSGIMTQGLQFQVPQNTFLMGIPNGISNVMTARQATIKIEAGLLLAIIPHVER